MKKPASVRILVALGYAYLAFSAVVLLTIVTISFIGPETSAPFFKGFYEGATGSSASLDSRQIGYLIGATIIPFLATVLMLVSLHKKSVTLRKASLIIFILLFLGGLGQGRFYFTSLVFSILLFVRPTREYFLDTQKTSP